jgi:hypothetical protein
MLSGYSLFQITLAKSSDLGVSRQNILIHLYRYLWFFNFCRLVDSRVVAVAQPYKVRRICHG